MSIPSSLTWKNRQHRSILDRGLSHGEWMEERGKKRRRNVPADSPSTHFPFSHDPPPPPPPPPPHHHQDVHTPQFIFDRCLSSREINGGSQERKPPFAYQTNTDPQTTKKEERDVMMFWWSTLFSDTSWKRSKQEAARKNKKLWVPIRTSSSHSCCALFASARLLPHFLISSCSFPIDCKPKGRRWSANLVWAMAELMKELTWRSRRQTKEWAFIRPFSEFKGCILFSFPMSSSKWLHRNEPCLSNGRAEDGVDVKKSNTDQAMGCRFAGLPSCTVISKSSWRRKRRDALIGN